MILTTDEILVLISLTKQETVVEPRENFMFRVVRDNSFGYSKDPDMSRLQSKLSIMLQVAREIKL